MYLIAFNVILISFDVFLMHLMIFSYVFIRCLHSYSIEVHEISYMQENKRKVKNMHELYFNTKSGYYGRNINNFGIINFSVRPLHSAIKK